MSRYWLLMTSCITPPPTTPRAPTIVWTSTASILIFKLANDTPIVSLISTMIRRSTGKRSRTSGQDVKLWPNPQYQQDGRVLRYSRNTSAYLSPWASGKIWHVHSILCVGPIFMVHCNRKPGTVVKDVSHSGCTLSFTFWAKIQDLKSPDVQTQGYLLPHWSQTPELITSFTSPCQRWCHVFVTQIALHLCAILLFHSFGVFIIVCILFTRF